MGKVNNHTSKSNRTLSKVNHKAEIVESLPRGWKVETRTRESGDRIGKKYKRYIDPVTGSKFYSREEVSRYLKSTQSETHVVIERRDTVDGLPPGWTMELKIRTKGERSRSDPYYKDPLTGYVFRSKKDVARYLKTGDLGKYAFRPKEGGIHTVEEINGKALISSTAKEKKVNDNLGNRELSTTQPSKSDAAVNDDRNLESSSAGGGDKGKLRSLSPADTKISKKATGKKVSVRKGVSRTQPLDKSPSDNQVIENGAEENERRNTQNGSRKRNHKIEFDTPRRTSKRLAGIGAEAKLPVMCTTINANIESVTDSQALAVEPPPEAKPNVNSMQINVPNEAPHITAVGPCAKAKLAVNSTERIDGVSQVATEEPPPDAKLSVNFGESNVGLASVMEIPNQTPQIAAAESCVNSSGINAELASVEQKPDFASQLEALKPPTDPELYVNSHVVKETLVERQHMEPPLEAKLVVTSNTGVWDHQQEPDKSVTGKHPVQQEGYQVYEKLDSLVTLPLGESWSDPCLEFAYKTLTGELPWEDNQPPENNQSSPFPDILPISDPCIEFAYKTLTGEIPVENNPVTPSPIPISDPCIEFAYKTLTGDIPVQDIPSNVIPISDPCLEFAYKTLMGEIPVEDCLSVQGYFQHQPGSSTTKTPSGSNELSDSSLNKLHIQTSGMFRSQNLFGSSNNGLQQHSNRNTRMDCSTREVIP